MLALLLSTALCAQDFDYRQGSGIVDLSTNVTRSPDEFLKYALAQREAGNPILAIRALTILVTRVPDLVADRLVLGHPSPSR